MNLSLFLLSFSFSFLSAGTVKSTIRQFFFFCFYFAITKSSRLAEIRWSDCISKSQRILWVSFSKTDSDLCIFHLFVRSNLNFLHNSPLIILPTLSCLVYSLFDLIYCILLLCDWSFRLEHHVIYRFYFVASYLFLLWDSYSLWRLLRCYRKWICFSLKASLSYLCPSFLVWDFACLSLELSIQLFLIPIFDLCFCFLFLFWGVGLFSCVVCIVSGRRNQSSSALFYVVF